MEEPLIFNMYRSTKGKNLVQLVFVQNMILLINPILNCNLIHQRKQAQMYYDSDREN